MDGLGQVAEVHLQHGESREQPRDLPALAALGVDLREAAAVLPVRRCRLADPVEQEGELRADVGTSLRVPRGEAERAHEARIGAAIVAEEHLDVAVDVLEVDLLAALARLVRRKHRHRLGDAVLGAQLAHPGLGGGVEGGLVVCRGGSHEVSCEVESQP